MQPFAIKAFSSFQVLVSAPNHVQQLASAPEDVLSFRKAMNDVRKLPGQRPDSQFLTNYQRLFFQYTMGGFIPNEIDPHNSIPTRVFKVLARQNLRQLNKPIESRISEVLHQIFEDGSTSHGNSSMLSRCSRR